MCGSAHATWRAIGTTVDVCVLDEEQLRDVESAVRAELEAIDLACSRFRDDSELVALRNARGRATEVSPLLFEAVSVALDAARRTGGAVDPTIGTSMRVLGWDDDFDVVRARRAPARLRLQPARGWRTVELDPVRRTIRTPRGVELDLGSVGKAWAADRCAARAVEVAGGSGVLVSLGGDIAVAGTPPEGGWRITIGDDHAAEPRAEDPCIALYSGGVATSSSTVRRWHADVAGGMAHHILDPRTGLPAASPWRTVTVAARSCSDANAASTAAIVKGIDALGWLDSIGVPARLAAGAEGAVVHVGPWPTGTAARPELEVAS